jgi:hypothetical protein
MVRAILHLPFCRLNNIETLIRTKICHCEIDPSLRRKKNFISPREKVDGLSRNLPTATAAMKFSGIGLSAEVGTSHNKYVTMAKFTIIQLHPALTYLFSLFFSCVIVNELICALRARKESTATEIANFQTRGKCAVSQHIHINGGGPSSSSSPPSSSQRLEARFASGHWLRTIFNESTTPDAFISNPPSRSLFC